MRPGDGPAALRALFRDYSANQLHPGGILMWVRVRDDEKRDLATKVLTGDSGHDVHTHDRSDLKRFAKNLTHSFSRNAAQIQIVARVLPLADVSG